MNEKQLEALTIVKQNDNLFLTGSAGTGKSYTINRIVGYLEDNNIKFGFSKVNIFRYVSVTYYIRNCWIVNFLFE